MRPIDDIIIHCAATYPTMDIGAKEIRKWHVEGNGWNDIGYHYVIRRNGTIEKGRVLDRPGAHCKGHNAKSIGICLVGGLEKLVDGKTISKANYTQEQWNSLKDLVLELKSKFPFAQIHGHQDYANKACPCFNVQEWWESCNKAS